MRVRDQCVRHSTVLVQIPFRPFVCTPQVLSCSRVMLLCVGKYRILQKIRHCAFGCARSNSPSHRAGLSALGQILLCSRAMMRRFVKYRIPQLKDKITVMCFSYLENLRRTSIQNLLIQHENMKRTKCLNSWRIEGPVAA